MTMTIPGTALKRSTYGVYADLTEFEFAVPCDVNLIVDTRQYMDCPRTAEWGVIVECPACGEIKTRLMCDDCFGSLISQTAEWDCQTCHTESIDVIIHGEPTRL